MKVRALGMLGCCVSTVLAAFFAAHGHVLLAVVVMGGVLEWGYRLTGRA